MKRIIFYVFLFLGLGELCPALSQPNYGNKGNVVTEEGAWCWFADPRALHYENATKTINSTYIGYIDVHGNIKATQHNFLTGETNEVLIRSWFQPDDHNNPAFLVLPDERIMIFYSRHTDEACFYYRISQKRGDITSLGKEMRIITANNVTYPSPFILSNDPSHIYLCWRGINWHPTIARLTLPDDNDKVFFDWEPKQIVQSTGARPYAKYLSNGKDKIYMTYTTGHPENQNPNNVYFNYINIKDTDPNNITLTDVKGKLLCTINNGVHNVAATSSYASSYPYAVVDNAAYRDWIWQVSRDATGSPVIAMVRINNDKTSHDYYYSKWTGSEWLKIFLVNGGGHFHQTPAIENCYSGGMAIDDANPNVIYCSVPVGGTSGKLYEIVKYMVNTIDYSVTSEAVTSNSVKNNIRPYIIQNSGYSPLKLVWMHGDYFHWIVSARSAGYPTAIYSNYNLYKTPTPLPMPVVRKTYTSKVTGTSVTKGRALVITTDRYAFIAAKITGNFTVSLLLSIDTGAYNGTILQIGDLKYGLNGETLKPYIQRGDTVYNSTNVLGTSGSWKNQPPVTDGKWLAPEKFGYLDLSLTYRDGVLTTYINGLIDQCIEIYDVSLSHLKLGGFKGKVNDCRIYNKAISQTAIKALLSNRRI